MYSIILNLVRFFRSRLPFVRDFLFIARAIWFFLAEKFANFYFLPLLLCNSLLASLFFVPENPNFFLIREQRPDVNSFYSYFTGFLFLFFLTRL